MHQTHPSKTTVGASRLNAKYAPLLAPAIMAMAMSLVVSLVMSLVQTIVRLGLTANLVPACLTSFAIGVIVAVPTAVLVAPRTGR